MKHVMIQEFKRLYKSFLIILAFSFLFLILNEIFIKSFNNKLINEYKAIILITAFTSLYYTIIFISDNLSNRRLMYLKADVSREKVLIGKLLIIFIFTTVILILMVIYLNIRAYQFYTKHYIDYLRFNLDDYGLILINRSFLEWFYPINLLLNLSYLSLSILSIFTIYKHLQVKKREKSVDIYISCFLVIIVNVIIKIIVNFVNNNIRFLNFNFINHRVRAMALSDYEINFLSLFSIIVYVTLSILIIKLSTIKVGDKR